MINRTIIRIKILQVLYSHYQKGSNDLKLAENELMFSLQKSYDLYHYLLLIIPLLTDTEQKRLDIRKNKFLASDEEKNPNTRFINNRLAAYLSSNDQLSKFANEKGYLWDEEPGLLKNLLDRIIESEIYEEYLNSEDSFESDREFWRRAVKNFICNNDLINDFLEDKSIYWNDDIDIIGTFVLKTIKKIDEDWSKDHHLMPMFKEDEDREYAVNLLRYAITNEDDYNQRIVKHIKNWDVERVANVDLLVMKAAIAEILNFSTIPVSVSLNEYIDIVKCYSTPRSGIFINGILDAIVSDLKDEKLLFKV